MAFPLRPIHDKLGHFPIQAEYTRKSPPTKHKNRGELPGDRGAETYSQASACDYSVAAKIAVLQAEACDDNSDLRFLAQNVKPAAITPTLASK